MRRVRGPVPETTQGSLWEVSSLSALRDRLRGCYDLTWSESIDLAAATYEGCVYVLRCRSEDTETAKRISLLEHGKQGVPWWVGPARAAQTRLYVGRAKDLPKRLWQHVRGAQSGGAHFTDIFSPERLRRVFIYDQYDERDALEEIVAQTVDGEVEDAFVYSDRYDSYRGFKNYGEDA